MEEDYGLVIRTQRDENRLLKIEELEKSRKMLTMKRGYSYKKFGLK